MSAAAFRALLRDVLEDMADAPSPPAGEWVSVLGAREARQLRYPITFVIGLCESEFPRRPREEPFFSVSELSALERAGVVLERRRGPEAYEPLLFYGAVASAEQALWLTYASADVDGKPLQPSHYLDEIGRLFAEETLDPEEVPLSQVAPARETVANPRELAELAFFDLTADADRESPVAYNALARLPEARALVPRILSAADLDDLRDSPAAVGPYVGEMRGAPCTADLAARFGPEHHFTASDLTTYAVCPFDFLCRCVLGLTEPEYAAADLDPRMIGLVRHAILSAFAKRRMEARPDRPLIAPGEEDEALAELEEIIRERFRAFVAHGGVADEALWEIERERCRRDMALWVHEEVKEFGEQSLGRVEFSFGWGEENPVHLPARPDVRLRGRIDRLNLAADAFVLIDYKSGPLPTGADVKSGLDLQFPIYALGAMAELPALADAACVGWRYSRVTRPLKTSGLNKPDDIAQALAEIPRQIAAHVDAIRAGRFSYVRVPKCADRCPSAAACRHVIQRRATDGEAADDDS
jgi:ATP-dependent helicase/nuclease subunit B